MHKKLTNSKKINIYLLVRLFMFISVAFYCLFVDSITVFADNGETIVHVTNTGHCYHREGCGHLRSDIEISLHDAVVVYGYNPCEDCNPPIYDGPDEPCTPMEKPVSNSGDNNSTITYTSSGVHNSDASTHNTNITNSDRQLDISNESDYSGIVFTAIGIGVFLCIIASYLKNERKKKIAQQQYEKERDYYFQLYANRDLLLLVDAPQGVYIKDGFPCTKEPPHKPYGDYTVYVASKSPKVFHMNPPGGRPHLLPVNYYFAYNLQHCKRCATGKIQLPTLGWYFKYMEISKIKQKYNLP